MQNQKSLPAGRQGISTLVGIIIIIAVAIVAFGGVFAYEYFTVKTDSQVQNQPDQTAGWKTYINDQYGFEIKYPTGTQIKKVDKGISFIFADNQRQLNVEIITGAESNECYKTAWAGDVPDISLNGTTFNGIGCGLKCEPYDEIQYCAIHNGIAYKLFPQIVYIPAEHNFVERDNILTQMLSTFKFTPVK